MVTLGAGETLGFKALPHPLGDLPTSNGHDWSALYPQLSFEQALAYLPNQWERGAVQCQIITLTCAQPISILLYNDRAFADGQRPAAEKAERLRAAYAALQQQQPGHLRPLPTAKPLMDAFGDLHVAIVAMDAEAPELILPHAMTTPAWLHISAALVVLEESASRPCSLGRIVGREDIHRSYLHDCAAWVPQLNLSLPSMTALTTEMDAFFDADT
ncbi:hypothetical protein ACHHYP_00630 [Achlya hypogyna]|uniref:Uncharacterized protein n=1 Tax=Achlya hypogyna TaxID=1202772 RepID=A0A1V9ZAL2_ACHHY|nr:hypothetical protein ACHHYP_00630 [Achlya hypogyna]